MLITFYGHACFEIKNENYTVLIDPFISNNPLTKISQNDVNPDYILVTHGHSDHLGDAIEIAQRCQAVIIAPNELAMYCQAQGTKVHPMHIGGGFNFPFGRVKLTPAWHGSSVIKGENIIYTGSPCGFIVEMGGKKIYHAGDTGLFGDMKLIGELDALDVALIPIGDNFVMGPDDAVIASKLLNANLIVPMHYNTFDLIKQDPQTFIKKLEVQNIKGKILEIGDTIVLKRGQ